MPSQYLFKTWAVLYTSQQLKEEFFKQIFKHN